MIGPTPDTGQTTVQKDEIEIVFDYTMVEYNVSNKDDDEEDRFEGGNDKNTTAILIPAPQQR